MTDILNPPPPPPPPYPPFTPYAAPEPVPPASRPPRSTAAMAAVVAAVTFVAGAAGGALLAGTSGRGSGTGADAIRTPGTTGNAPSTPSTPSGPSSPSTPSTPSTPSSPSTSNGDGGSSATSSNVSAGVVDISTVLADDGGEAAGTGMIISKSGLVLTNNHVIDNATTVKAQIGGVGRSYNATVLGYDATHDVALLQLQNASGLATVTIGNPGDLNVGDSVTAVGNALGRPGADTVVTGTITDLHQDIEVGDDNGGSESLTDMIETNANIQPGDSGGPLLDSSGRVIGMVTAGSVRARRSDTTGFAIPITTAKAITDKIQAGQATSTIHIGSRGMLGVELQPAGRRSTGQGATVAGVEDGSPAAKAGMAAGDTIRSISGHTVTSENDVAAALTPYHAGDSVAVTWVDSGGQSHHANITLKEGPPA